MPSVFSVIFFLFLVNILHTVVFVLRNRAKSVLEIKKSNQCMYVYITQEEWLTLTSSHLHVQEGDIHAHASVELGCEATGVGDAEAANLYMWGWLQSIIYELEC